LKYRIGEESGPVMSRNALMLKYSNKYIVDSKRVDRVIYGV